MPLEHTKEFFVRLSPICQRLALLVETRRRQVFIEIGNTAALSDPHPIVIIHTVLQTLVEKANFLRNTRTKKHCWLANKTGLAQVSLVNRLRGIATNDLP